MSTTSTTEVSANDILNSFGKEKKEYEQKESKLKPYMLQLPRPEKKGEVAELIVRVLPNKHTDNGNPFEQVLYHYNLGKYGSALCLRYNSEECPMDAYVNELFNQANDLKKKYGIDSKDREKAKSIPEIMSLFKLGYRYKEVERYYVPVVARSGDQEGKIVFYGFSDKAFDKIKQQLKEFDPEVKVFGRYSGYDIKISISNSGQEVNKKIIYNTDITILGMKQPTPCMPNMSNEEIDAFVDKVPKLQDVLNLEKVSSEKMAEIVSYLRAENKSYVNDLLGHSQESSMDIPPSQEKQLTQEQVDALIDDIDKELDA